MILVDFTANDVAELQIAIKGVNSQETLTETFPNYNVEIHILGLIQFYHLKLMGKAQESLLVFIEMYRLPRICNLGWMKIDCFLN